MEKNPEPHELDEARGRTRPAADAPVVESDGPYAFAPEALRAAYDRAYEEALRNLRE